MDKKKKGKDGAASAGKDKLKSNKNRPDARELASKDQRFASVFNNPIYRPVPKKEKKIDIDKRFQSMFHGESFKLNYKVDKRGRPVNTTADENLMKYYNLVDDEGEDIEEKPEIKDESESEDDESDHEGDKVEGEVDEKEINERPANLVLSKKMKKKLHDMDIDYARGEGHFASEPSSEDDSSSDLEDETEDLMHEWGELDKDAERTETSTRRLALCNMDWDRLKANDLMVLFTSFLPPGGLLNSVAIYTSEFGKSRMAEEELKGPLELVEFKTEASSDFEGDDDEEEQESRKNHPYDDDDEDEGSFYQREKLRQYQLNRLKYFYAVLEFDSVETAEKVYEECDGREYESSATKIDLRFIPDDTEFDDVPSDKCESVPEKYRPKLFTTTALQQVKVGCTWDETDPSRKEIIEKIFNPKEKIDDEDIRAYLASSEDESEPEAEDDTVVEEDGSIKEKINGSSSISKYLDLLKSIEETEKKKKNKDVELEITWGVGLKKKTEELVKKKLEKEEESKRTPWEEQLAKRKEKKKERKLAKQTTETEEKGSDESSSSEDDEDSQPFSDDEVDIDMSDPFFRDEMKTNEIFKQSKSKQNAKSKSKKDKKDAEEVPKSNAELELLLMDDEVGKKHFSLNRIVNDDNETKSKKKRKLKKLKKKGLKGSEVTAGADFDVNLEDSRFSALFTSHHYNIDPSDLNFKKTKAMEVIIGEKQKRRIKDVNDESPQQKLPKTQPSSTSGVNDSKGNKKAELSYLVKSIKRNTLNMGKGKHKSKPRN